MFFLKECADRFPLYWSDWGPKLEMDRLASFVTILFCADFLLLAFIQTGPGFGGHVVDVLSVILLACAFCITFAFDELLHKLSGGQIDDRSPLLLVLSSSTYRVTQTLLFFTVIIYSAFLPNGLGDVAILMRVSAIFSVMVGFLLMIFYAVPKFTLRWETKLREYPPRGYMDDGIYRLHTPPKPRLVSSR
ncbi:MAG: hypothetical protein JWN18_105 [Parcubacteria group bacterium]|nr:hypothetical protein [Parcubacteria group bacterium]